MGYMCIPDLRFLACRILSIENSRYNPSTARNSNTVSAAGSLGGARNLSTKLGLWSARAVMRGRRTSRLMSSGNIRQEGIDVLSSAGGDLVV